MCHAPVSGFAPAGTAARRSTSVRSVRRSVCVWLAPCVCGQIHACAVRSMRVRSDPCAVGSMRMWSGRRSARAVGSPLRAWPVDSPLRVHPVTPPLHACAAGSQLHAWRVSSRLRRVHLCLNLLTVELQPSTVTDVWTHCRLGI